MSLTWRQLAVAAGGLGLRTAAPARALSTAAEGCIDALEAIVQRDEGNRGIGTFTPPPGELRAAAKDLFALHQERPGATLAILTGFPCNMDHKPPTETDGPLGAVAVARAFLTAERFAAATRPAPEPGTVRQAARVLFLTDDCNAPVMNAAVAASGMALTFNRMRVQGHGFSPGPWDDFSQGKFDEVTADVDHVLAIERTGPGRDGSYYTMRGVSMDQLVAPLEQLTRRKTRPTPDGGEVAVRSTGIGDGGNELGMGKVLPQILTSNVPKADRVACVEPTDNLLVCSVSNWGGYALAAALTVLAADAHWEAAVQRRPRLTRAEALEDVWMQCMPHEFDERGIMDAILAAGARCGMTRKNTPMVDGMPFDKSIDVLDALFLEAKAQFAEK